MEILDALSEKVHQAARELMKLKQERQQMLSELELLRRQIRDHQTFVRENEKLKRERDQLRTRLLRLNKKIEKHLLVETTLASHAEGGIREEYSQ